MNKQVGGRLLLLRPAEPRTARAQPLHQGPGIVALCVAHVEALAAATKEAPHRAPRIGHLAELDAIEPRRGIEEQQAPGIP